MTSYSKFYNTITFTKVNGISTWSKINGLTPTNWAEIYTYTTNATATTITNWIGAAISTSAIVPNIINGKQVAITASSTFNVKTTLTNCYIEQNATFLGNSMDHAFNGCSNLKSINFIPPTVSQMYLAFAYCGNLETIPTTLPSGVTNMRSSFFGVSKIVNFPNIPNGVTTMYSTFGGCSNMINAPTISSSATNMSETFRDCVKLQGNITIINTSVVGFTNCFRGCNASLPKTLRCPTGSASYNLAINVCNGKNGVTVVAY